MPRIEPYSSAYEQQYLALYIATWQDEPYRELFSPAEVLDNLAKNLRFLYLLVDDHDEVIGFVGGRPLSQSCEFFDNKCVPSIDRDVSFYIDELGIAKTRRGAGFGAKLTEFLIGAARDAGYSQLVLRTHASESNPAMVLYERLGFERRNTITGTDHVVDTTQIRVDQKTPETDPRIYYYKTI
jgi:ribosomal protein S18 acetylase RimI-like enzyme